jgi:tryptophanyl-tRNA synthetase
LIFAAADLHALTVPRSPQTLRMATIDAMAALRAMGLNQERSTVFVQSAVPFHAELQWILSCTASTGYLSRMTQWKVRTSHE